MATNIIKNEKELDKKIAECFNNLKKKFEGTEGSRCITICGGTGCLSSESDVILKEFEKQIKANKLENKVTVNKVGCFGFCSQGPFVKIYPEDTLYRTVSVADVKEIMETDILGGKIVDRLLYVDPKSGKKITKQEDIPFCQTMIPSPLPPSHQVTRYHSQRDGHNHCCPVSYSVGLAV